MSSKNCLLFSTADWDTPYWTNKQHTARLLARRGWRVLYIESVGLRAPNMASGRDWHRLWRRLWRGLRSTFLAAPQVEQGVWVLSPLIVPFKHHWPIVRALNQYLLHWGIARFTKARRFGKPMVWTYHPYMLDVLESMEIGALAYHCVDDLAAVPGVDAPAFNREEQRLLKQCTAVFTTATALQKKCSPYNPNTHYFPNVVDATHFGRALTPGALPAELQAIPQPRLVYHGVLSDFKIDFSLVLAVANKRPDWHWVFIGEEREGQHNESVIELRKLPNVHFIGFRSYDILPDYLRGMDVGLLPTLLNDYTRSMFPMKYYEYLAAGLPVVSTRLDFTRQHQAGLLVADDAESFERAVASQLRCGKLSPQQAEEFVGNNTWDARLDNMLAKL